MTHLLKGAAEPQNCKRFHVVYYLKNDLNPVLTGVNYEAKTMLEAMIDFLTDYPERADDILYIIHTKD